MSVKKIEGYNSCPNCGEINDDDEPELYTCPRCDTEGYECCFPAGRGTICLQCEESGEPTP